MSGSYARLYRQAREAIEREAENLLGRNLLPRERNLFRNCGTLSKLEELGMQVYYASTGEELASKLAELSFESRFLLAVDELKPRLERMLQRPLHASEVQQLHALHNIEALWELEEQVVATPAAEREAALSRAVAAQE